MIDVLGFHKEGNHPKQHHGAKHTHACQQQGRNKAARHDDF